MFQSVALQVEDGLEICDIAEEDRNRVYDISAFLECSPIDEPSGGEGLFRGDSGCLTRSDDEYSERAHSKTNKSHDAYSPSKADPWLEVLEHKRINGCAEAATNSGQGHCPGPSLHEVFRNNCNGWYLQTACTETHADALGEEYLPVSLANTRHHEPEGHEKSTRDKQCFAMPCIIQWPDKNTDRHEAEYLNRSDPGNCRRRRTLEMILIICLEDAETIKQPPAIISDSPDVMKLISLTSG